MLRRIPISAFVALTLLTAARTQAKDCSESKKFLLTKAQVLSGLFDDPTGAILSGVKVQLTSEKKVHVLSEERVNRALSTDNSGRYDFGEVPPGNYRLRVEYSGGLFCAPDIRCIAGTCTIDSTLKPNPKKFARIE
jgi:carboxypeptidase family protein